jgi:hypothetical protein
MQLDKEKFKALFLYICWKADASTLGSTKLNKILWLADFKHYYRTGKPLTGARYLKRKFGPVPAPVVSVRRELEKDGSLIVKPTSFHGYEKHDYFALGAPDMERFSKEEMAVIDAAMEFVCYQNTARSISELSHDKVWRAADDGEEIPYYTIFSVPGKITEDDRAWAQFELEGMAS